MNYKPTVLLADNDESFALTMATLLERMGFDVIPVKNGLDTLSYSRQLCPDVLLINKDLPLIDGLKVLTEIRKDTLTSFIPVVLILDSMDDDSITYSKSLYCKGHLAKPVSLMDLNRIMFDCLSHNDEKKRRHMRIRFNKVVSLSYNENDSICHAVTLSEGGIFLRGFNPPGLGESVSLSIPIDNKKIIDVTGSVLYTRELYSGFFNLGPGMAIGFESLSTLESELLKDFIVEQLSEGITEHGHITH